MTRNDFNRRYAVTEDAANYGSAEDQLWTAQDVARVNDDAFRRVRSLDVDDYHTPDAVKHVINDVMTSLDTDIWFSESVRAMRALPVRQR